MAQEAGKMFLKLLNTANDCAMCNFLQGQK